MHRHVLSSTLLTETPQASIVDHGTQRWEGNDRAIACDVLVIARTDIDADELADHLTWIAALVRGDVTPTHDRRSIHLVK